MKVYKLILMGLLLLICNPAIKGQALKDLYYAQPKNTGLYMGFVPLTNGGFLLAGINNIFLFNEQKLIVDTLNLGNGQFSDNLYLLLKENNSNKEIIELSTLNNGFKVLVKNNSLTVMDKIEVGGKLKVEKSKFDLIIPWEDKYIAREKKGKKYYILKKQSGELSIYDQILKEWPELQHTYRGSEFIALNKVQVFGHYCFIYDKRYKKLIIYDAENRETQINRMPETTQKEFIEFYLDGETGKGYLFKYNSDKEGWLYTYDWKTNNYYKLLTTKYLIRGVFNNKVYISGLFDDTYGHYLIPITGSNEEILLLDEKQINEKN